MRHSTASEYYFANIGRAALENGAFRRVLHTTDKSQVVVMCLLPGENIGGEKHPDNDQIVMCLDGKGHVILGKDRKLASLTPSSLVVVNRGTYHDFVAAEDSFLRIMTIYTPPLHAPGAVHATKKEGEEAEQ